jgi:aerobic-type carbon monoxide dehydrogenase small subunit (CoxS/CutS family)
VTTSIRVNDTLHELSLDSRVTLLDALRDVLGVSLAPRKGATRARAGPAQSSSTANVFCRA